MIAAAYVRVSSKAQTFEMQTSAIERAATLRGDTIQCWYSEKASARTIARPELERLRQDVRARRVLRVYTFALDRLSRSGIADTFAVVEDFRQGRCDLVPVMDPWFSFDGPAAEVVLAVMAWAAKHERQRIGERISAARDRLEAQGRAWGRPRRMDEAQAARARELRAAGRSVRAIAIALKIPRATVARALAVSQKDAPDLGQPAHLEREAQQGPTRKGTSEPSEGADE